MTRTVSALLPLVLSGCLTQLEEVTAPVVQFTQLVAGTDHVCGLAPEGEVFCWSRGNPRPRLASGDVRFREISTFWDHTCGIGLDDRAYCWGMNTFGKLGIPLDSSPNQCGGVPCAVRPELVSPTLGFRSITAGAGHTCAVDLDQRVFCWGLNSRGQLGTGIEDTCTDLATACASAPVLVAGDLRFRQISAGRIHTCGVTLDDRAFCWGEGANGRLGHGTVNPANTPVPVAGGLRFRSVSAGGNHACGVSVDGEAHCWGSNSDMQLATRDTDPDCGRQITRCFMQPVHIALDTEVAAVVASDATGPAGIGGHSCLLTGDGVAYCWGLNENGQLLGGTLRSEHPLRIDVDASFTAISAGRTNTCGLTTDQLAFCWAYGSPWSRWYRQPG